MKMLSHRDLLRSSSSHRTAIATSSNGHQPTGSKAKADNAPAMNA
jgi:hypothetical protein